MLPLAATAAVTLAACGDSTAQPPGNDRVRPSYNAQTGALERITYDRDGNGTPDAWADMDGGRIVRVELDEDGDGTAERREFYVAGDGPAPVGIPAGLRGTGVIDRAEEVGPGGNVVVRRERYVNGVLAAVEEDSNADGRIDKWETWADGTLRVLALDTQHRGTPDRRLTYSGPAGVQVEVDPEGTGQFRPAPRDP